MKPLLNLKRKRILSLLAEGKRIDGRNFLSYRDIKVEAGIAGRARGSALVSIGNTKTLVATSIELEEPFPDTPEEGILKVEAELLPIASPMFEPGPPGENAIELARIVDRELRSSKAIDLSKLCIIPGKVVFGIFIDISVLNHDGNLTDASALAALKSLIDTKVPTYEARGEEVELKDELIPLQLQDLPLTVTFAKLNGNLLVDPSAVEEQLAESIITIGVDQEGRICTIQKRGGSISFEILKDILAIAREKADELRKRITE